MGESVRLNDGLRLSIFSAATPTSDEKNPAVRVRTTYMTFREWASSLGFSHKNLQTVPKESSSLASITCS